MKLNFQDKQHTEYSELFRRAVVTAWPSALESFLTAFVNLVDAAMVSGLGTQAIAAVGLTAQPRFLALVPFMTLQMAVSALIARRRGQNDAESANRILRQALLLAIVASLLIGLGGMLLADPLLHLTGSQPDTHVEAVRYFRIVVGCIVFQAVSLVTNAAQRGCGNTKIAFYTNSASNLVNITCNYLLIEGRFGFPALGVSGAAVATVLGTVVAACISLTSVCRSGNFLKLTGYCGNLLQSEDLRALARLSRGIFTEQICKRMGLWMYAMLVARLGTENFAAHQISTNLLTLCFSIGDGLSIAAVSLIGQSLGAQQPKRAREYLTIIQRIGLACSALFSLLFFSCGQRIFSFFTNDPIIMAKGIVLLRFVAVIVFLQITQVIYFGCLRGAGDARYIAMVTFLCIAVLRPSLGALLCYGLGGGLYGAWTALVCEQICRLLLSWRRVKTGNWTKIEL